MKKLVILVHGFNITKWERTVGKLSQPFKDRGFKVVPFRYGHTNIYQVMLRNPSLARKLSEEAKEAKARGYRVYVVGHSNGVAILRLANIAYKAPIDVAVCINPALSRGLNPCPQASLVQVYHNAKDTPVILGKWLRRLTPWARASRPWGEMGRYGYLGNDANVVNFDTLNDFEEKGEDHSGVFKPPAESYYKLMIPKLADEEARVYWPN